jgi:hypothetical protein
MVEVVVAYVKALIICLRVTKLNHNEDTPFYGLHFNGYIADTPSDRWIKISQANMSTIMLPCPLSYFDREENLKDYIIKLKLM